MPSRARGILTLMGAPERAIIEGRLASLEPHERRFRINAGQGWVGEEHRVHRPTPFVLYPGDVLLRRASVLHAAPSGWPDLAGWDSVVVTPEMVGTRIAVFVGEEIKAGRGRLSRVQVMFRDCLTRMGGRWRVIRDPAWHRSTAKR